MQSPSGIDYPTPRPVATRLRAAIGIGVVVLGAGIVALILWGVQEHNTASAAPPNSRYGPATATAAEVVARRRSRPTPVQPPPPAAPPQSQQWQPAQPPPPVVASRQPLPQVQPQVQVPQMTAEERAREAAYQAEQKALEAPASPSGWKTIVPATISQASPQHAKRAISEDQDDKEDFLREGKRTTRSTMLASIRTPSIGKYVIATGWLIPSTLETMMDSDLPGEITALVRANIYDTATGRYLLIPQGSRLFGAYNSHVSYGQRAAQAAWYRIVFPDASTMNLEGMQGHEGQGRAGFRDKVDNHYKRLIGTAILTSAFMAGGALAQSRRGSVLGYPSAAETAGTAATANMQQEGLEVTRRNLNIQPTIEIRSGYKFDVMVNKDMEFDGPYQPIPARR